MADKVRAFPDWIDAFLQYTDRVLAPKNFRRWTAYSILSGIIERKVWSAVSGMPCFTNLYILLVAEPGVGKSVSVSQAKELWVDCGGVRLAPSGMTKAALIDHMSEESRTMLFDGMATRYHPLSIGSGEFGTMFPDYNLEFMNVFNEMYDSNLIYEDRTRKDGIKQIERPFLTMIAGTQPPYLGAILPIQAFGMGFTSRIIMVYSSTPIEDKMFPVEVKPEEMRLKLIHDMKLIQKTIGPIQHHPEALEFIEDWFSDERKTSAPDHPLLRNYCTRRHTHVHKLAMISSLSRGSDLIIETQDYQRVLKMLYDAERDMPEIFKQMTVSNDERELEEVHRFAIQYCIDYGEEAIPEQNLTNFMSKKIPVNRIDFFITTLCKAGKFQEQGLDLPGYRKYKPMIVPKTAPTKH